MHHAAAAAAAVYYGAEFMYRTATNINPAASRHSTTSLDTTMILPVNALDRNVQMHNRLSRLRSPFYLLVALGREIQL